jgi:hypothetical protein
MNIELLACQRTGFFVTQQGYAKLKAVVARPLALAA